MCAMLHNDILQNVTHAPRIRCNYLPHLKVSHPRKPY